MHLRQQGATAAHIYFRAASSHLCPYSVQIAASRRPLLPVSNPCCHGSAASTESKEAVAVDGLFSSVMRFHEADWVSTQRKLEYHNPKLSRMG
jgi:hypothetical protein